MQHTLIDMSFSEQDPPDRFRPDLSSIFKQFEKQSNDLRSIFADTTTIEETVKNFTENNPTISKMIEAMRLSVAERTFTLTPLLAKYSEESEDINIHQVYRLLRNNERRIDHVFVQPIDALEGLYYHYELYIPIPEDMRSRTPDKLLQEHWGLVHQSIPDEFNDLVYQFEPRYTIERVYGWEGSWLAYSVIVKDVKMFWSTPLKDAPFCGTDPFLLLPKGEFAILENDGTAESIEKITHVKERIDERSISNHTITFKRGETIEVTAEWIAAHMASTIQTKKEEVIKMDVTRDFGEHVASATIDQLPNVDDVLKFMKEDVMGTPEFKFDRKMIQKNRIHRKSLLKNVSPTIFDRIKNFPIFRKSVR